MIETAIDFMPALGEELIGRRVYHATSLHYVPSILGGGEIVSASVGSAFGVGARGGAARRDRMLGVDRFVHLAFDLVTPLLQDKLARGMPHVVFAFDAGVLYREASERMALLPFNTKAWRSRSCYGPVTESCEMAALLRRRDRFGRNASLELLVEDRLSLSSLIEIVTFSVRDETMLLDLAAELFPAFAQRIRLRQWPKYILDAMPQTVDYYAACRRAGRALPPPRIAFD